MTNIKTRVKWFVISTIFFFILITLAYSQAPKQCPNYSNWIDPSGFTSVCNIPDCSDALNEISKWVFTLFLILVAYFAGLKAYKKLSLKSALFRVGVFLELLSVIFAISLSKVPNGYCLDLKPVAYLIALLGSFLVAWFYNTSIFSFPETKH